MDPKFNFGKMVYIKKGFYRSYKAEVKSFSIVKVLNQKTGDEQESILYRVKIDEVPSKDLKEGLYDVPEDWLIPYKKYVVF
jgi:hypothetical protein